MGVSAVGLHVVKQTMHSMFQTSSLMALFQLTEQHLLRAARFDAAKETHHFGNKLHFVLTK